MNQEIIFSPSDFVAVLNQTMEFAYPIVSIEGELANVRISRGKWVYFDIKDESASVKCFGTVYMLPGPIEEGMVVRITASPRMHPLYNFSLNIQSIAPIGEGSIKRASDLLKLKLDKEGLFDPARKRSLPYAPESIGLITSGESAAYSDFNKILNARWGGVTILHYDVLVQGDKAPDEIINAINEFNQLSNQPEVLVITRGGGSADDLAAFSSEQVVRAIAGSRILTVVAIGHESDVSLAELAADVRASTPSNAAELLTPDKKEVDGQLRSSIKLLYQLLNQNITNQISLVHSTAADLKNQLVYKFLVEEQTLARKSLVIQALDPQAALRRGYAVLRRGTKVLNSAKLVNTGDNISIQMHDGSANATINEVKL